MADVKSAAQWIGQLLAEEVQYLNNVGKKMRELQDELEWMQCLLRDADASQIDNSMARKWVAQIREFAYEAEDCAEKFLMASSGGTGRDVRSKIKKYTKMLLNVIALHKMGNRVDALKHKMNFLTTKLRTYGIQFSLQDSLSSSIYKGKHDTYFTFKRDNLIGREDVVMKLLHNLSTQVYIENELTSTQPCSSNAGPLMEFDGEIESKVVSICGVGGIGKTFVANEIFHHPEIRRNYQAFAWASISRPCQITAVQQELLGCLTSKSRVRIAQMTDVELKRELRSVQLRKKCLIVLDGLWEAKLWEGLKGAFPIACRGFKGKILLTTRLKEVARSVHPKAVIHELDFLDRDQSKSLLEEKFNYHPTDISGDDLKKRTDLTEKMLIQCRGLPLAIVVLGGILVNKKTKEDWEKLEKNFSLYSVEKDEESWKKILDLSYYELPYQLKPCFIYLGYFPTNLEMTTTKLSRLWEAEGLVSSGDSDESEETLQVVAESYLAELVERSLIQVSSRDLTGRAKTCRLHRVMQDLCIDKAKRANWLSVVQVGGQTDEPSGSSSSSSLKYSRSAVKRKSRRVAIYCSKQLDRLPSDYRQASYVRSLLFFNTLEKDDVLIPMKKMALKSIFKRYELLRVLDIENIGLSKLPSDVGSMIHLRYLSLRGSWVSELPYSIKYLRFLQTLDLRVLSFVRLMIPNVLSRLERLVHLYLPAKPFKLRNEAQKLDLKNLVNLETLSNFSSKCNANDIGSLTNLREFSSCDYLSIAESLPLLELPSSSLIHLYYISLRLDNQNLTLYPNALYSCKALRKLWVKGKISEPINSGFLPPNLNKLSLSGSGFLKDPMPILEKLPQLKELNLEQTCYQGTILSCKKEGFKELKYLYVECLENMEDWVVEEGAMPKLFSLEINRCHKLRRIPEGLRFVTSLQELMIVYMPLSFFGAWTPVKSLKKWDEYWKVQHVPRVDISKVLDIQKTNPN